MCPAPQDGFPASPRPCPALGPPSSHQFHRDIPGKSDTKLVTTDGKLQAGAPRLIFPSVSAPQSRTKRTAKGPEVMGRWRSSAAEDGVGGPAAGFEGGG